MSFSITFSYHPYGHFSVMPWSLLLGSIQHHPPRGSVVWSVGQPSGDPPVTTQDDHIFFRKKSLFETFKKCHCYWVGGRSVDPTNRISSFKIKILPWLNLFLVKKYPSPMVLKPSADPCLSHSPFLGFRRSSAEDHHANLAAKKAQQFLFGGTNMKNNQGIVVHKPKNKPYIGNIWMFP